jgi:hypothetical protein
MTTPSLAVLTQRLAAVEARLAEIENGYGQVIYTMRRDLVRVSLGMSRILQHLNLDAVTDAEVDAILDET